MAGCNSKIREVIGYRAMKGFYYICDFLNTAVQIWFVLQLADGLFEAKVTGKRLYIGQAAVIGAVALVKCGNDILCEVLFSNNMLLLMAFLMAVCSKMLYENRWFYGFCLNIWGFTILTLVDFFLQTFIYQMLEEQGMPKDMLLSFGIERGCYLLIFALLLLPTGVKANSWLAKWRETIFQYRRQGLILLLPMVLFMIYFQNIYLLFDSGLLLSHWKLFIQGSILLCVLFGIYIIKRRTDEEAKMQQLKIEMLESNYLVLRQVYDEKERLLHDMKNHMYIFRDILERDATVEALEYVGEIIGELRESGNLIWTKHKMMNLILNRKFQEARKADIPVHCECDDMSGLKLTTMELCALIANLLDNAIEANERCPKGVERRLDVECRRRENMLIVTIENSITEKAAARGVRILERTEKDKREHGYGMRSIRKVVNAYGGDIDTSMKGEIFRIRVSLAAFEDTFEV